MEVLRKADLRRPVTDKRFKKKNVRVINFWVGPITGHR